MARGRLKDEGKAMWVLLLVLAGLCVAVAASALKIVPQTDNFLVERLGKYHRTLAAGVHILAPFIERVAHRESILERQLPAWEIAAFTRDNVKIGVTMAIFYRVTDAARAWYRIKGIDGALETLMTGIVRSAIGGSDLDQAQSNRAQLSSVIGEEIRHVTDEWGIAVTRVEILDVGVDEATRTAMQRQLNAERTRRAVVTEAEGKRQAANLEADAALYTAEQQAKAQRVLAEAQAYAVSTVAEAINAGGQAAINFDVRKLQAEAIRSIGAAPGTRLVLLPSDVVSALTGLLGGGV